MTNRKPRKDAIVKHEIFAECAKLEKIPFWVEQFENFSKGHFPKNFVYKDRVLSFKRLRRKGLQKVDVPTNPVEAMEVVKNFMRAEAGTLSSDEHSKKRIEMSIALKTNLVPEDQTWKDIRAPTVKRQMIAAYVYNYVQKGDITENEARNLTSIIVSGLAIKAIKPEDIQLKDGQIVDIDGVDFDGKRFYLLRVPEIAASGTVDKRKATKTNTTGCRWEKLSQQYDTFIKVGSTVK